YVAAQVTTAHNGTHKVTADVTVQNTAPTIQVKIPKEWITYYDFPVSVTATDAGIDDTLDVAISWGDGTNYSQPLRSVLNESPTTSTSLTHQFSSTSSRGRTFRVVVTDDDGAQAVFKRILPIIPIARLDESHTILIGGTDGPDRL